MVVMTVLVGVFFLCYIAVINGKYFKIFYYYTMKKINICYRIFEWQKGEILNNWILIFDQNLIEYFFIASYEQFYEKSKTIQESLF